MERDKTLCDSYYSDQEEAFFDDEKWQEEAVQMLLTNKNIGPASSETKHFNVLNFDDIRKRQESAMKQVSSLCCISPTEAATLLRHFMWYIDLLADGWFADEQKIRSATGLLKNPPITTSSEDQTLPCEICKELFSGKNMKALACGHYFCCECLMQYIHTSIDNDGLGCLRLRCPHPECDVVVGEDMVLSIVTDEEYRAKFEGYLLRSYVEQNRRIKECPAPGCEFAVELVDRMEGYDVVCKCSHTFCWNCLEENHRPVDCETVRKWAAESDKWIHGDTAEVEEGSLQSCQHYYQRWAINESLEEKALSDLKQIKDVKIHILSNKQCEPFSMLKVVIDAWWKIIKCRRILKWTYVYAYFLTERDDNEKIFFEFRQDLAEAALEKLHEWAEKELGTFVEGESRYSDFRRFCVELDYKTSVICTSFDNLVISLGNELSH